jgi:hypothetical protein
MINLSTANIGDKFLTREGKSLTYIGRTYYFEKNAPDHYDMYPTEMYNPDKSFKFATFVRAYSAAGEISFKEFAKTSAHPWDASCLDLVEKVS